jgi:predicted acyltransferase
MSKETVALNNSKVIAAAQAAAASPGRLISIDALRGFDMFWIVGGDAIFRNLQNISRHPITEWINLQLQHCPWQGFRFYDLIMPLFLFIVGAVMPFSLDRRIAAGSSKLALYKHILLRVIILWLLGMIQDELLAFDLNKLRLYSNTLQAIASGYLIAAVVMLHFRPKVQHLIFGGLLLAYWALLTFLPVPGAGPGQLTPEGNLAIYIDKSLMGRFQDRTAYTWILSSMTFAATVLMGVFAGRFLRQNRSGYSKVVWLLAAGLACLLAGLAWSTFFPIIKYIWSSSFVLFSGGICLILLGLFYLVIDVWGYRKWAFGFVVIGSNAIVAYMLPTFVSFRSTANFLVTGLDKWLGGWTGFIHALITFGLLWLLLLYLYRKKTFVKI